MTYDVAQVVRFYPKRGYGYRLEKDHLALEDAASTLCGVSLDPRKSSATHLTASFEPDAPYSCKRCVAALRRRGAVCVFERISYSDDGHWSVVG